MLRLNRGPTDRLPQDHTISAMCVMKGRSGTIDSPIIIISRAFTMPCLHSKLPRYTKFCQYCSSSLDLLISLIVYQSVYGHIHINRKVHAQTSGLMCPEVSVGRNDQHISQVCQIRKEKQKTLWPKNPVVKHNNGA